MKILSQIKKMLRPAQVKEPINIEKALAGDTVFCVCCGQSFITFLPFGLVKRANAFCPGCGSLERHRLHWHYMINKTNLLNSAVVLKILHVAPEEIFYSKFSANDKFDYVPCAKMDDDYPDKYPANTINADITDLQFSDNSFDVIYCSHVLEHIPEDLKAMQELLRILKPSGWAMLQVPVDIKRQKTYEDFSITDPAQREIAFGQTDHVRVYGRDYGEKLESTGFIVQQHRHTDEFSDNDLFKFGFQKGEDIYLCTKS